MKRLLLMLVVCGVGIGQQSNTLYQTVVSGGLVTGPTSPVNNIGQSTHFINVSFTNRGAFTCTDFTYNLQGQLEYSYDSLNWTPFGNPQASTIYDTSATTGNVYTATGAYPFVRFNLVAFNTGSCKVNIYYSGTLVASNVIVAGSILPGTSAVNRATTALTQNPVVIGGYGNQTLATVIPVCNQTIIGGVLVGTGPIGSVSIASLNSSANVYICNLTATSTGTATVQLALATNAGCSTNLTNISTQYNLAASTPLVVGMGIGSIINTVYNGTPVFFCAVVTGNTVNLNLSVAVMTALGQ